jgi:murein DD-endopeptidase
VRLAVLLLPLFLAACASTPSVSSTDKSTARAASSAVKMVGKPYKYGGASPAGFDCSGLVHYSYRQAGLSVPRSTAEQRRLSQRIKQAELKPGDLLFFDERGKKHSRQSVLEKEPL